SFGPRAVKSPLGDCSYTSHTNMTPVPGLQFPFAILGDWRALGFGVAWNVWADPYRWAVIGAIHRRPFLCSRSSTSSPGARPDGPGHSRNRLCLVVFAPVAGWLYDHWAARTVVPMGGQVLGVVLALTGQVMSLTQ